MFVFKTQLESDILKIVEQSLEKLGYYVVRLRVNQGKQRKVVQIMLEKMSGEAISLDDCEKASNQISVLLDLNDIIRDKYYLEISSTGVNRPLTTQKDFEKYINHQVKIALSQPIDNQRKFFGKLLNFVGENIELEVSQDPLHVVIIPVQNVSEASLEYEMNNHNNKKRVRNAAK